MAHDKAYTFVAALLRRSKNRTATNLDHYAKRSLQYVPVALRIVLEVLVLERNVPSGSLSMLDVQLRDSVTILTHLA